MVDWLGVPAVTTQVDIDEAPLPGEAPRALAIRLAREKTLAATAAVEGLVLTADTVVDLDGAALGKPADADEARRMLRDLRALPHQVHTGVALALPGGEILVRCVTTDVLMRPYSDAEIDAYIATGDPMDKAGAYAIQHPGFHPVDHVDVCYANVVGLPLCAVVSLLAEAGWTIAVDVHATTRALCRKHFGYACPRIDVGAEECAP